MLTPVEDGIPWSLEMIHAHRKQIPTCCVACMKNERDLGRPLRRCGQCQSAFYCSPECQTLNWPAHKRTCGEATISKRLQKLVKSLMSIPSFFTHLHSCCILAFDLLHHTRCDEFLRARLSVAVEPVDVVDFAAILLSKGTSKKEGSSKKAVQGMLQVNGFTVVPNLGSSAQVDRQKMWRIERAKADSEGFHDYPLVILDICPVDAQMSVTVPFKIAPTFFQTVTAWKSDSFTIPSGANEETISVPYTVETCMEFINATIRADAVNDLLRRTEMRQSDIKVIREAGGGSDSASAISLHAKIAREHIYSSIYKKFVERRKAAGKRPSIPVLEINPV
ncbi:hypothetical protein C8R45DRAFT_1015135 [Mycena sanguinolenta]|nr:hypothetical protein C8R45DRAFT_1015135 [Mycena sanguinolenta]